MDGMILYAIYHVLTKVHRRDQINFLIILALFNNEEHMRSHRLHIAKNRTAWKFSYKFTMAGDLFSLKNIHTEARCGLKSFLLLLNSPIIICTF